jgi:1,4-dihydroxy-2-naphthoate octaprenyltransferase
MFIQLGTNMHNDAVDSERGGDGPDRVGPPRVTAMGLLSASNVKRGAAACFTMAATMGLYLVLVGGWPILLLGVLSIVAGWAYNGGPLPIAYTPLGEIFVIAFFGVGAVGGTYWLCTDYLGPAAVAAGLALGLLAAAVLLMLLPFTLLPMIGDTLKHGHVWPTLLIFPMALVLVYRFMHEPRGRGFNRILIRTVQMQFLFGLMLCVGLAL